MSPFSFVDYKAYLRAQIKEMSGVRALMGKLAEAAGCQRSYLSQVLGSAVQLTPDHAYGLAGFFELTESEIQYFLLMVDYERAASSRLRKRIEQQMKKLRGEHLDLSKRVDAKIVEHSDREVLYYANWLWSAIHIATSIPSLQTVAQLSQRLQIPGPLITEVLMQLQAQGYVRNQGDRWIDTGGEIHLSKKSPLIHLYHSSWRQRATVAAQSGKDDGTHYTTVSSLSGVDFVRLNEKLVEFIGETRDMIGTSNEEELACFTCSLFRV